MYIYPNRLLFLFFVMSGSLISVTSHSWFSAWMGLEINLMAFVPLLSNFSLKLEQSPLKYFLAQAWASLLLFMTVSSFNFFIFYENFILYNLCVALIIKLGGAPFHFWVPLVCAGSSWPNIFILLTWQKMAPLILLNTLLWLNLLILSLASLSAIVGGIMGINQTSLRSVMAFSSINHLSWMLLLASLNFNGLMIYFLIYSLISFILALSFNIFNLYSLKQLMNLPAPYFMKMLIFINLLSLGGLPPFLGFMPKWFSIMEFMHHQLLAVSFVLVMSSLLSLYYYLRVSMMIFVLIPTSPKWSHKNFKTINPVFPLTVFSVLSLTNFSLYPLLFLM